MHIRTLVLVAVIVGVPSGARASGDTISQTPSERRLVVVWQEGFSGPAWMRAMSTLSPWEYQTPPLEIGRNSIVRSASGKLYVVSLDDDTITVVDPDTWTIDEVHSLPTGSEPVDIAVVSAQRAYLTRRTATHLLRFDPTTGTTQDVVDLGLFADADGVPDMNMMAVHEGRLFVQIRRADPYTHVFTPPGYLAVVDVASEQLIDVDPTTPGVQAIELVGTFPCFKMQIVPQTRRLFVSASGEVFDDGGIEMVDLDSLQSLGLVVREADGTVGVGLGAFVLVTPENGYLTCTTDWTLSSHLVHLTVAGGADPDPYLHDSVGYFVPIMLHDALTDTFFFPEGREEGPYGVHVFDAATATRLTPDPIPTSAPPTDLAFICRGSIDCSDPNCAADPACANGIPTISAWGLTVMILLLLTTGTLIFTRRRPARRLKCVDVSHPTVIR